MDTNQDLCRPDTIVIGGSAGAVEAARRLVAGLPEGLAAALFVAIHRTSESRAYLAELLARDGPLPAVTAAEGMTAGRDHVHVRRGPRENRAHPALDVLFRSAAVNITASVIGGNGQAA